MKSLRDLELKGKRVLMRVDFNVPTDKENKILDDAKITALPTIKYVLEQGETDNEPPADPGVKTQVQPGQGSSSPVFCLIFRCKVDDCIGEEVQQAVGKLQDGQVLLENVDTMKEEKRPRVFPVSCALAVLSMMLCTAHRSFLHYWNS